MSCGILLILTPALKLNYQDNQMSYMQQVPADWFFNETGTVKGFS
jgi:hypothetical protein